MSATAVRTVRQSFAALYERCHLAAKLGEETADQSTAAQARGTISHRFMHRVVADCVERQESSYDPALAKELMADLIARSGLAVPVDEYETLMGLAWKVAAERSFAVEHVVDLEENYTAELGAVTVTGRPDYLAIEGREATIRDYKTSFAVDPEADVGGTFQGRWYAWLVFQAWPQVVTVRVVLDYVRWGTEREAVFERESLDDLERYVVTVLEQIERSHDTGEWPASPGHWCAICPAPDRCPIPFSERGDGAAEDAAVAQAYAAQVVTMEELLKRRKKALRAYVSEHEPIRVGDLEFGFQMSADSERCIDKDALREAMRRAGLDWSAFFRTTKGSTSFKARKAS